MPAEKGVRDGHTDALSGTAVLGGEGHFSLLDTVGDRGEGRSSIGGLLDRGMRGRTGQEGGKQRTVRHSGIEAAGCYPALPGCSGEGFLLGSVQGSEVLAEGYLDERVLPFAYLRGI